VASNVIPTINIAALFNADSPPGHALATTDRAVFKAATTLGFMAITGLPHEADIDASAKQTLTTLFNLTAEEQRSLWKRNFEPSNPNLYRGWFPLHSGPTLSREGFEIGPDVIRSLPNPTGDVLLEPTPLPSDTVIPQFRTVAGRYYAAMETIGAALLASLSRGLGIAPALFRDAFTEGISTLRLLRYIPRHDLPISDVLKTTRGAHVDTGMLTLLAPVNGALGLEVEVTQGNWLRVPAEEGTLVVNFGGLLERWTGGLIKATRHGVGAVDSERFSIPFFMEPSPDTLISPLPLEGIPPFKPFLFGDHLWATTTQFTENWGLSHLRPHRSDYEDPLQRVLDQSSSEPVY
jgi:isopenicillin N synthase-like dioxygenase